MRIIILIFSFLISSNGFSAGTYEEKYLDYLNRFYVKSDITLTAQDLEGTIFPTCTWASDNTSDLTVIWEYKYGIIWLGRIMYKDNFIKVIKGNVGNGYSIYAWEIEDSIDGEFTFFHENLKPHRSIEKDITKDKSPKVLISGLGTHFYYDYKLGRMYPRNEDSGNTLRRAAESYFTLQKDCRQNRVSWLYQFLYQ